VSADRGPEHPEPRGHGQASVEVPRPPVTEWTYFSIVPTDSSGAEPAGGPRGSAGVYDITFVLGVPGIGSVVTAVDIGAILASGDSMLASGDVRVELSTADPPSRSTWLFRANAQRRLARAEVALQANNFPEAHREAYNQVMPQLSRLALEANVPIEVRAVVGVERQSRTVWVGATVVGATGSIADVSGLMTPELAPLLATYREGLNSTAPLYQALSFFKVTEAVSALHTQRTRSARRTGTTVAPDPTTQTIPASVEDLGDTWTSEIFRDYLGMTFGAVKESFTEVIRNAVAHLTPGREIRIADRLEDIDECRRAVPVLRYMAREMIRAEITRV
jgi:hypothetical protein